jgi:hypothetical protein
MPNIPAQEFHFKRLSQHRGYDYKILRREAIPQPEYIAVAENLSLRTDVHLTEAAAEQEIRESIERTYAETFGKQQAPQKQDAAPKAAEAPADAGKKAKGKAA